MIKMIKAAALNDELHFITDEEKNVVCKDVALMSKEQTFSKPLFDGGTYLMRGIEGNQESRTKASAERS